MRARTDHYKVVEQGFIRSELWDFKCNFRGSNNFRCERKQRVRAYTNKDAYGVKR